MVSPSQSIGQKPSIAQQTQNSLQQIQQRPDVVSAQIVRQGGNPVLEVVTTSQKPVPQQSVDFNGQQIPVKSVAAQGISQAAVSTIQQLRDQDLAVQFDNSAKQFHISGPKQQLSGAAAQLKQAVGTGFAVQTHERKVEGPVGQAIQDWVSPAQTFPPDLLQQLEGPGQRSPAQGLQPPAQTGVNPRQRS